MTAKKLHAVIVSLGMTVFSGTGYGAGIANGDFENSLGGWEVLLGNGLVKTIGGPGSSRAFPRVNQ